MITGGIQLEHFLIVSTIMFFVGVYGFLVRRNLITILMSIELMLNSVNINFVAFNRYLYPQQLQGHFFILIVIAVAAAEAAVAILFPWRIQLGQSGDIFCQQLRRTGPSQSTGG